MPLKAHRNTARARTRLLFAVVWAAAFAVGLTADVRLPGGAVILFDGNLERAIHDVAGTLSRVPADQSSSIA